MLVSLSITTYEFYDGDWHPTLTHTFYGKTEQDARKIMEAHRNTDSFFNGSFSGKWNGLILKNSDAVVQSKP